MARLDTIRLPNGAQVHPGDWTTAEPLYSTGEFGAGMFPVLTLFSYSFGAPVPGSPTQRTSTILDTNLEGEGNRLPEDESLIIFNISCLVTKVGEALDPNEFPDAENPEVPLPDMLRLQRDLVAFFRIANIKEYTNAPISYFPAGQGVDYSISGGLSRAAGGLSGTMRASNGSPSPQDVRTLASPLYVAGGETMALDLRAGPGEIVGLNLAANARLVTKFFFDGYRKRPVA